MEKGFRATRNPALIAQCERSRRLIESRGSDALGFITT
jgi:hypothetical protein